MRSIAFPGRFSSLNEIRDYYTQAAKQAHLNKQAIYDVQLAVDEAASNIINHAYGGENKGEIECSYQAEPGKLEVFMRDNGKPFKPEEVKPPDLNADVNERKTGGLGLHFMKSLMDKVEFTFNGKGGNILRMVKTDKETDKEKDKDKQER